MPSTEAIRAAIVARMAAVPRIGVVHPYERYTAKESAFASLYMWQPPEPGAAKELRGWFIRRVGRRETEETHTSTQVAIDWQIRGYTAIRDAQASEVEMDGLVDAVIASIKADLSLGGLLDGLLPPPRSVGAQLMESGPYMFAGVLCHGVRLDWTTVHIETDAPSPTADVGWFRTLHANWDIPPHGNVQPPLPADAAADATDHVVIPET